jgi:hypothetical protein
MHSPKLVHLIYALFLSLYTGSSSLECLSLNVRSGGAKSANGKWLPSDFLARSLLGGSQKRESFHPSRTTRPGRLLRPWSICTVLKPDEDDHELWASCYPMDSSDPEDVKIEVSVTSAPAVLSLASIVK